MLTLVVLDKVAVLGVFQVQTGGFSCTKIQFFEFGIKYLKFVATYLRLGIYYLDFGATYLFFYSISLNFLVPETDNGSF